MKSNIPVSVDTCEMTCLPQWLDRVQERIQSPLARKAMHILRNEPTAFVSVGEWANRLNVSREHLTRSFSGSATPHSVLLSTRLVLAMGKLARQERLRAGEALDVMGYSSRAHAFTVFKSAIGMTPSQWWQLNRRRDELKGCVVERCPLLGAIIREEVEEPAVQEAELVGV